jgi:uncharacterized membrane protein
MADETKKHLFVLGYPDRAAAEAAIAELRELERDQYIEVGDYAIVSKGDGGKLTIAENRDADPGAERGAVTGALAGAFVAMASTPIGLAAIAVGAGVGAIAAAVRDSGFKGHDLEEVGALMRDGRTILLLAARPEQAERMRSALDDVEELRTAEARWEAEVSGDSKNVLHDAIAQYRQQQEQGGET